MPDTKNIQQDEFGKRLVAEKKTEFFVENMNYEIAKKALSELEGDSAIQFTNAFYPKLVSLIEKIYGSIEDQAKEEFLREAKTDASLEGELLSNATKKLIYDENLNDENNELIIQLRALIKKETRLMMPQKYERLIELINKQLEIGKHLRLSQCEEIARAMTEAIQASKKFTSGNEREKTKTLSGARHEYLVKLDLASLMNFLHEAAKPRVSWIRQKEYAETKSMEAFFEKLPKDDKGLIKGDVCDEVHVLYAMNKTISALKHKPFSADKLKQLRKAREDYIIAVGEGEREASLKAFLVAAGVERFRIRRKYAVTNSLKVFYESIPDHILSMILKREEYADSIRGFKDKMAGFKAEQGQNSSPDDSCVP